MNYQKEDLMAAIETQAVLIKISEPLHALREALNDALLLSCQNIKRIEDALQGKNNN